MSTLWSVQPAVLMGISASTFMHAMCSVAAGGVSMKSMRALVPDGLVQVGPAGKNVLAAFMLTVSR